MRRMVMGEGPCVCRVACHAHGAVAAVQPASSPVCVCAQAALHVCSSPAGRAAVIHRCRPLCVPFTMRVKRRSFLPLFSPLSDRPVTRPPVQTQPKMQHRQVEHRVPVTEKSAHPARRPLICGVCVGAAAFRGMYRRFSPRRCAAPPTPLLGWCCLLSLYFHPPPGHCCLLTV